MKPTVHIMSTATPSHHWFSGTESTVNNTQCKCTMHNPIYSAVWPLTQVNNTHVQCSLNTHSNQCKLCTVVRIVQCYSSFNCSKGSAWFGFGMQFEMQFEIWNAIWNATLVQFLDWECNASCRGFDFWSTLGNLVKIRWESDFGSNPMVRIRLSNQIWKKIHLWTSKQLTQLMLMVVVMNMDRILMTFLTMMAMLTSPPTGKL